MLSTINPHWLQVELKMLRQGPLKHDLALEVAVECVYIHIVFSRGTSCPQAPLKLRMVATILILRNLFPYSSHFNLACSFSEWITSTALNGSLRSETVWNKYFLPIGECWLIYTESSEETLITENVQLLIAMWPLAFRDLSWATA